MSTQTDHSRAAGSGQKTLCLLYNSALLIQFEEYIKDLGLRTSEHQSVCSRLQGQKCHVERGPRGALKAISEILKSTGDRCQEAGTGGM